MVAEAERRLGESGPETNSGGSWRELEDEAMSPKTFKWESVSGGLSSAGGAGAGRQDSTGTRKKREGLEEQDDGGMFGRDCGR